MNVGHNSDVLEDERHRSEVLDLLFGRVFELNAIDPRLDGNAGTLKYLHWDPPILFDALLGPSCDHLDS
jgi:hypothetical protein